MRIAPQVVLTNQQRAGNERRNTADDIDVCLHSLRKWAGLAAKGNPAALHFLFSRNYALKSEPWQQILKSRDVFLSRQAARQFRGFAEAQVHRLQGIGTGKKGQRHELIGAHGIDIKAAMRFAPGITVLSNSLFRELEEAEAKSGLPEKVDRNRISVLVSDTYLNLWNNSPAAPGCLK